jgi:signal transduction histidine kinase
MRRFSLPRYLISLMAAIIAALLLVSVSETGYHLSAAALARMETSQRLHSDLDLLLRQVVDAETGQRGYLLTGDARYLEPYHESTAKINPTLERLRTGYAASPSDLAQFTKLSQSVAQKLSELDFGIKLRTEGNDDAWRFALLSDLGRDHMNAIRSQVARMILANKGVGASDRSQVVRSLTFARFGILAIALISLALFYLFLRQSNALKQVRERQKTALEQERDRLEKKVRERTASLAELATHLQLVREDERAHLARELHDELGSLLTAAKLDVARLKPRLAEQAPDLTERLRHLNDTLNSGIALKRRIIEQLRPSSLTNLGLVAAIEILARETADLSGLSISTDLSPVTLDETSQLTVYRLVQEALTNICKYADAEIVTVTLRALASSVSVEVRDDGAGFDVADMPAGTHGLSGMRHRVEARGGQLTVASTPGSGTQVLAVLPMA